MMIDVQSPCPRCGCPLDRHVLKCGGVVAFARDGDGWLRTTTGQCEANCPLSYTEALANARDRVQKAAS